MRVITISIMKVGVILFTASLCLSQKACPANFPDGYDPQCGGDWDLRPSTNLPSNPEYCFCMSSDPRVDTYCCPPICQGLFRFYMNAQPFSVCDSLVGGGYCCRRNIIIPTEMPLTRKP